MRRLLMILALTAVALSAAAAAGAAPPTKIADGSARKAGTEAKGWFVVANSGPRTTSRTGGHVTVDDGRLHLTIARWTTAPLPAGARRRVRFRADLPARLHRGEWRIDACTHGRCLRIGRFRIVAGEAGAPAPGTRNAPPPGSSSGPIPKGAGSGPSPKTSCSPSTGPLSHPVEEPFRHRGECGAEYFGFVPASYRASTPMPLLIWAHGCGGEAEGDAWNVGSYTEEPGHGWLALSLGGRDGECWTPSVDEAKVIAALEDFEAHFNVDHHRVFLSGYSSGGDLAYRTGFRHSSTFAGLIIENSSPFRDTESTQAESLAAATTKLHIVHLAHAEDETYPLATVQSETNAVKAAGFPLELIVKPGTHYDGNTDRDLQELLVPYVEEKGWTSP